MKVVPSTSPTAKQACPSPQTTEEARPSYAFVMNAEALREPGSYQLIEGHQLRRATPEEIAEIKETLAKLGGFNHYLVRHLWERRWPRTGRLTLLAETDWRYFVVAFTGINGALAGLQNAFDLATAELEIAFTIMHSSRGGFGAGGSSGFGWDAPRLFEALQRSQHDDAFFEEIDDAKAAEISTICKQLRSTDDAQLKQRIAQFGHLKGMPYNSPLRVLGYFAILESLLTHHPKPTDPYDSITGPSGF